MNRLLFSRRSVFVIIFILLSGFLYSSFPAYAEEPLICADDIEKYCKKIKPGGGRLLNCLKSHETELSVSCKGKIEELRNHKRVRTGLFAVPDIEYSALKVLIEAEERQRARGIQLWLVALNPEVRQMVERSSLWETLGRERLFFNMEAAVGRFVAQRAAEAATPTTPGTDRT